jgi:osmoprotectant transport system permease protein
MPSLDSIMRFARAPSLWLTLALLGTVALMPYTGPIFHAVFPENPRPVYTRATFVELTLAHLELVAVSSLAAAFVAIGLGIFVTRESGRDFAPLISALAAIGQTFPPVAVLALAIPMLGYGSAPTIVALTLYAVLPILEGTITGLRAVPTSVTEAATGMGFSALGRLLHIELPLARPFIVSGLRTAVIINIGTAAIGSSIGALSLGSPIIEGLSAANPAYVLQGAIIVALLAVVVDRWFDRLELVGRAGPNRASRGRNRA